MESELIQELKSFQSGIETKFAGFEKTIAQLKLATEAEIDALQKELARPSGGWARVDNGTPDSVGSLLTENWEFKAWAETGFTGGKRKLIVDLQRPLLDMKTVLSSDVASTNRERAIDAMPRQKLRLRSILDIRPMTVGTIEYLKQTAVTSRASPQAEGGAKGESTITYTPATATARTIAHHTSVSKQALADVAGLRVDIDSTMLFELLLAEESELLWGDGLGEHLNGIGTLATAYDTGLSQSGDTPIDKLRHAVLQCVLAKGEPNAVVLNPSDLHDIELVKEDTSAANTGGYIVGNPRNGSGVNSPLWGLPVIESLSQAEGTFLVGDFRHGATLYERMAATIEISFEHGENFTKNLATILCEERVALAVKRPLLFVKGSF